MVRQVFASSRYFCFLPGLGRAIFGDTEYENHFDQLQEPVQRIPETGFDRIRAIFGTSKHGLMSKEQTSIVQLTLASFVVGTSIGMFKASQMSYENFIATNMHEKFLSAYEAKRKLLDTVTVGAAKGGYKWGMKCAVFTLIYSSTVVIISAYRNKEGVLEHSIGGALAGAFARAYLGYKAALVGAGIGSFLSSLLGMFAVFANKGFNVSLEDVREYQYELRRMREEAQKNVVRSTETFQKQDGPLLRKKQARLDSEDDYGYKLDDKDKVFVLVNPPVNDNKNSKKET